MNSWCLAISGQVTCRSRASASSGNHPAARSRHSAAPTGGPPGARPSASAGARYLRTVLRSSPRLSAIWFLLLPAYQCARISVTSTTSNVLLAIGPPPVTTGEASCLPDDQARTDTPAIPMGNNVTPPAGNYVLTSALQLGNYVIADMLVTSDACAGRPQRSLPPCRASAANGAGPAGHGWPAGPHHRAVLAGRLRHASHCVSSCRASSPLLGAKQLARGGSAAGLSRPSSPAWRELSPRRAEPGSGADPGK
jgi:hypothetical protein